MRTCLPAVLAAGVLAIVPLAIPVASAKEKAKHDKHESDTVQIAVAVFLGRERDLIREYCRRDNLPPGLAKRGGDLPPGLAKQLRRKGHLPPGLEKKVVLLPVELERQLSPLKPGLKRGIFEGRVFIYDPGTSLIADIFVAF